MKTTLPTGMLLASLATAAWAATCLPTVNNDITVDGIVVGTDIGSSGQPPPSCPTHAADIGWAGILAQDIPLDMGITTTATPKLFLASHSSGGVNIDRIYFAVHVENTPDFTTSDKLTVYFHADASNSNWDPAKDFALLFDGIGTGAGTPSNTDGCGSPGGPLRYFKPTQAAPNTSWAEQLSGPPAGITYKVSWDYEQVHDPEWQLWELEVGIDVSSVNIAVGGKVGIGAKLYLFQAGAGGGVTDYHYPTGLTPIADTGYDFSPNKGGVTPATLDPATVGNCALDVVITSIQGSDDKGNPGQFSVLDPSNANDFDPTTGAAKRQNHFTANVQFVNPGAIGSSPLAIPNSGNVTFRLRPWNGGFTDDIPMAMMGASFNQVPQSTVISIAWPTNRSEWRTTLNAADHACLFVDLSGFTVDLPNGNEQWENLAYVSASTIKTSFVIAAPRELPGILSKHMDKDGRIEYILRVHWDNLAPKFLTGRNPFKYRITNASALGLKPLGKGYYSLRLKPGEQKRVALEITGGTMPNPNKQYKLSAKAGGKLLTPASGDPPLEIPVKAGAPLSIVARGKITTGKHSPTDANGYPLFEPIRDTFLMRPGFYRPQEHVGTVIGSCDKFRTSFVIGTDATFVVPQHCESLLLAINDVAGRYDDNNGEFEINVVAGAPIWLPTRLAARGSIFNAEFGVPAQMPPGSILPQFIVDVGQRFKVEEAKFQRLVPTGGVYYAIYDSHPGK